MFFLLFVHIFIIVSMSKNTLAKCKKKREKEIRGGHMVTTCPLAYAEAATIICNVSLRHARRRSSGEEGKQLSYRISPSQTCGQDNISLFCIICA